MSLIKGGERGALGKYFAGGEKKGLCSMVKVKGYWIVVVKQQYKYCRLISEFINMCAAFL